MRGVFALLIDEPDGMQVRDLLRRLEERVPPTPFEAAYYPDNPNVRRYEKIVRFSTITAVKAGWMVKDKGQWSVTADGTEAFRSFSDPEKFDREARARYKEWKAGQPRAEPQEPDEPNVRSGIALEEAEEAAWEAIRAYVAIMPPYDFQELVGALLRAMGYYVVWISPPGPDRGIDLIAHNDPLGTTDPRIVVQVKRYGTNKVTSDALRSFLAVLGDKDVGIFICPGGFTSDAEREARTQERRRLTLIDLNKLVALWIEHFDALPDDKRQLLPLKPVHFLNLESD
jgi:restriction system protein